MSADTHRRLEILLDREIEAARSLQTTLDAERAVLTGNSPEAVLEKAARKTELFGEIETLEAQRRELCSAASISLPNLRRGRASVISGVPEQVADRWHSLLELIAGCRLANEVNGYIINARRGQVNQLFQVIRGGGPVLYGPQGKTFATSLRALARA
jgi:flagellar biosynthesis/type III secretory pathway chaperone